MRNEHGGVPQQFRLRAQSASRLTRSTPERHLGALGFRVIVSGQVTRMRGIAFFALSADFRSRTLESEPAGVYRGGYGVAMGTTFGTGAMSRGRVVSGRQPTSTKIPAEMIQSAGAFDLATTIRPSSSA